MALDTGFRKKATAEAICILTACPYCRAPRGEMCRQRYAGERLKAWGHRSRVLAAKAIADQPAVYSIDQAFAGLKGEGL